MRQRLLILSFSPLAQDARVLKQIAAFAESYDVVTCGYGPRPKGVVEHISVPDSAPVWRYPRALVVLRQYRRAYAANQAVAFARDALASSDFDVVLANDVEAVGVALSLNPRFGVHADLHEYSPRQREDLLRFRLFVRPFVEWMCRRYVACAGSWSTVSAGLAREYERKFGFRPEVVTNAAPFADLAATPVSRPVRLVHSGAALRGRHIESMITAVEASTADVTLDLYLTENDPGYVAELHALQSARVTLHRPVPYRALVSTLNAYDVGIFLLPPTTFNYRWALPNKLFDFVQARLGVIVGPSPEMAEYVARYSLGAVADGFDPHDLTVVLDRIEPGSVARWKAAAEDAAGELAGEHQVMLWKRAVDKIAAGQSQAS